MTSPFTLPLCFWAPVFVYSTTLTKQGSGLILLKQSILRL